MNFKITPAFSEADFQKEIDAFMERVNTITEGEMERVGLEFVKEARDKTPDIDYRIAINELAYAKGEQRAVLESGSPGFNDQTGNLRSSIGFILVHDGEIVSEDFELSKNGTDKNTGLATGRKLADDIAKDHPEGWAIITVAGMEYASWVEALGYDVITGSTLIAEVKLKSAMKNVLKAFK